MPKQFRALQETNTPVSYDTALPTGLPIAIYYRQSTDAQIGNISTTLQTVDMVKYLKQQGWAEDNIILIDMDGGVSGTKKIDERPGMSELFRLITTGQVAAVCCQDEDRLFRDVTQIQVNVFIEACRSKHVLVITPGMVYNFHHELTGSFHARQFRFKCEMAAEYINSFIKGKLHRARSSLAMNGQWSGAAIPAGYMIDTRKTLPDGSRNPDYKKYAVFEPYAMVIREYFRLYMQYSGNIAQTLRHIHRYGPYYPDPATCLPPEGFRVQYSRLLPNKFGRCPSAVPSLINTYTNPVYIGHWVINNMVVKWNNHPPIVDEAAFYFAFNRHSSFNLDGSENTEHQNIRFNERPSLDEERPEDRPLLAGLVFSEVDGKEKLVGTHWNSVDGQGRYFYYLVKADGFSTPIWQKSAEYFDATVVDLLLTKLRNTFDFAKWEADVDVSMQEVEADLNLKKAQLTQLGTVMENLVTSLASLTTPQLIAAIEKKYQDAEVEHHRLNQEVAALTAHIADVENIKRIRETYQTVVDDWEGSSRYMQREIAHSFIAKVVANKIPGPNKLHLTVHWRDKSNSKVELQRMTTGGTMWLPQDVTRLIELVDSGASKVEIAKAFPDIPWKNIYFKYHAVTRKSLDFKEKPTIKKDETYHDYVKRVGCAMVTTERAS